MAQLIRHRQRAITAISPHNGNSNVLVPSRRIAIVPNRRATTQLGVSFSLGTGATDLGSGQYRLTGPGAMMEVGLADAPSGRYVLSYDVINAFIGGVLYDTPKGDTGFDTKIATCADPIPEGFRPAQGGMVPSQNGEFYGMRRNQQVPANAIGTDKMFRLVLCSDTPAGDYETYGNFKLERYLG